MMILLLPQLLLPQRIAEEKAALEREAAEKAAKARRNGGRVMGEVDDLVKRAEKQGWSYTITDGEGKKLTAVAGATVGASTLKSEHEAKLAATGGAMSATLGSVAKSVDFSGSLVSSPITAPGVATLQGESLRPESSSCAALFAYHP